MGCCFSSQASTVAPHDEHERIATPPPQIPPEEYDPRHIGVLPDPIIAAPVAISGATEHNMPAIVEAMTPNEVGASSSASSSSSSAAAAASQHVILEPTVYVPPSRQDSNGVAELEDAPGVEEAVESPEERPKASSSSSSGSSSSSSSKSSQED